ncbi:glycoside hydrolase family 73 protein [Crassaminicella profunda]|uniref:glycoside hydrolase family 73 protein n=1 Tax=Crassaminicella profunda TaxID=1286698 RepID=UPI001CA74E47|nr:glucosaminidase domain-containing protein [Crassaminicella profunda]QZY55102.1 glucosaminidase domain-containing protein [Crassaminicella profunda]
MNKQEFINKLRPTAKEGYEKYSILPSLCIAQACLESSFGTKHMGSANNYFGFKSGKYWKGKNITLPTKEWNGEKMITVQAEFRAYDNLEESIRDYQRLIGTVSRYKNVCKSKNYLKATNEVYKAGYATDPHYPKKLQQIIEEFHLDQVDEEVLSFMKDWRIEKGLEAIERLKNNIISSPEYWRNVIKENPDFGPLLVLIEKVMNRKEVS